MRALIIAIALATLATACAKPPPAVPVANGPSEPSTPAPEAERRTVPQLVAAKAADADQVLIKAGLIPILRYEPGIVTEAGTVVDTDPAGGSLVEVGATVTVHVAGAPGKTLNEYVDAHREIFVGIGTDSSGVLVVSIVQSADAARELAELTKLADGRSLRLQTCSRSWVDLYRIQVELSKRRFLPGAEQMSFATAIDPLACAVRMTAELSDADAAELTGRYSGGLVIQKGVMRRGG